MKTAADHPTAEKVAPGAATAPTHNEEKAKLGPNEKEGDVNRPAPTARSDAAAFVFSLIKDDIVNFVDNSRALMAALDEVVVIHPFTQGVVSYLKTALTLILRREVNDNKVIALHAMMCDMLAPLTSLKYISADPDIQGETIADRLSPLTAMIIESIQICAIRCDTYCKRNLAVRYATRTKWHAAFAQIAEEFVAHHAQLQQILQPYTPPDGAPALGHGTLASMAGNVETVVGMVLELLRTPEERELAIWSSSADAGVDGEQLRGRLRRRLVTERHRAEQGGLTVLAQLQGPEGVAALQREIAADVETLLGENEAFVREFEAMRAELDAHVVTAAQRVDHTTNVLIMSPQERIADEDIRSIWKAMGWRDSVRARDLTIALCNYLGTDSATPAQHAISHDGKWTRVQPLMEAIDTDFLQFVNISEVNTFTSARPAGWSLSRWIAYWTYGSEAILSWYGRRIRALFSGVHDASRSVLPANRMVLREFLSSREVSFIEDLLSGLHAVDCASSESDRDTSWPTFRDYAIGQENALEAKLRDLKYFIDGLNVLAGLVQVGQERPEAYVLPLVFLLLRRSLFVIRRASNVILDLDELAVIQVSLAALRSVVVERVDTLRAMFQFHGRHSTEQLENFSFGVYTHACEKVKMGPFWEIDPSKDAYQGASGSMTGVTALPYMGELNIEPTADEAPLCFDTETEELKELQHAFGLGFQVDQSGPGGPDVEGDHSLVGHWAGSQAYHNAILGSRGLVRLTITAHKASGAVLGHGMDAYGPFVIRGTLSQDSLAFIKHYDSKEEGKPDTFWYHEAKVRADADAMEGSWGLPRSVSLRKFGKSFSPNGEPEYDGSLQHYGGEPQEYVLPPPGSPTDKLAPLGTFTLVHRPIVYSLACPSAEEFRRNRARALWRLAMDATLHDLRSRRLDWATLRARRDLRKRYVALQVKRLTNHCRLEPHEKREFEEMSNKTRPDDLHIWNALSSFQMRREVVHRAQSCSTCRVSPIRGSYLVCLSCTHGIEKTAEFCFSCFTAHVHASKPWHPVVQFRVLRMRIYLFPLLKTARTMLDYCSNDREPASCAECTHPVKLEHPRWCCLECYTLTYVCTGCNHRIEQTKPWLLERFPNPDYHHVHDWSHALLLIPSAHTASVLQPRLQLGTRQAQLSETKSDRQSGTRSGGLGNVFARVRTRLGLGKR